MEKEHTEFRVRPVARYIVTKAEWIEHDNGTESASSARQLGPEYANEDIAYEVGYALARAEAERLGCELGSMRVIYPQHPGTEQIVEEVDAQSFMVPVEGVLHGARNLVEVAVVGISQSGGVEVFSSMGTPQTIALLSQAQPHIEAMRTE